MTRRLKRASVFAAVSALALAVPAIDAVASVPGAAALPFLAVAAAALFVVDEGELFDTLATPGDYEERRLIGLGAFALAAAGLALFATVPEVPMPMGVFAAAVVGLGVGRLGKALVRTETDGEFAGVAGFLAGGFLGALLAQVVVSLGTPLALDLPAFGFLAAVAALVAALLRSVLYEGDDHIVMVTLAFTLWLFAELSPTVTGTGILVALGITAALGYVSYALGTASVPGMLTGVLLALLAIVLGGAGWFGALIAFYAIGGLASKYRFEEKAERGVAQENQGARGSGNVLANSAVALVALVAYAATGHLSMSGSVFAFAFAGAIATAMADTLSSEIGGVYDDPRLITTFERVEAGTDGAVTWQGELAGIAGALLVAAIAAVGMPLGDPVVGGGVVLAAGFLGMTADSLLGALVEGDRIGNQTVNFLATLVGALVGVAAALLI